MVRSEPPGIGPMVPLAMVAVAILGVLIVGGLSARADRSGATRDLKTRLAKKRVRTADHSKFAVLQKPSLRVAMSRGRAPHVTPNAIER